jgi:hypothetical protein
MLIKDQDQKKRKGKTGSFLFNPGLYYPCHKHIENLPCLQTAQGWKKIIIG